jgi:non-specific serine/threonine protein kinase
VPEAARVTLTRDGDVWLVASSLGASVRVRHGKGFDYLRALMDEEGRDVHVLELVAGGDAPAAGDAGPMLDARAKQEYRARLASLAEDLDESERDADRGRAERVREEIDRLTEELARAVGLGGRDRRAASDVERARINVQRRLRDVIDRITTAEPALGRYLAATVKTGTFCAYRPV